MMSLQQSLAALPAGKVVTVDVFAAGPHGGNPAPVVLNASAMSDEDMQAVARQTGHESGFVKAAPAGSDYDFSLHFWVPNHEMEMCGHVTVGTVWLMTSLGILTRDKATILTRSGKVYARIVRSAIADKFRVEITQPAGQISAIPRSEELQPEILSLLGIKPDQLADTPVINACTSRIKTLVPLKDSQTLHNLQPNFSLIAELCQHLDSTGLYPYAPDRENPGRFFARQFPKSSGYQEDAATGIAAAALAFGLRHGGQIDPQQKQVIICQGQAMGRPSQIEVTFRFNSRGEAEGCWLGGDVRYSEEHSG